MTNLLDDVESLVDALGQEKVHLAGHDWGALVGWPFASQRQGRVKTWSALSVGHPHALAKVMMGGDADQAERSSYIRVFNQEGVAEKLLSEDGGSRLRAIYQGVFPKEIEDRFVEGFKRPGRLTAALNYYRANLNADRFRSYDPAPIPIEVPTQLIWGSEDPALGRAQAEGTAAHMHGPYHLSEVAGAGHWLQHERPGEITELLLEQIGG